MPLASLTRCRHPARGRATRPQVTSWFSGLANSQSNKRHQRRWYLSFCGCLGSHVGPLEAHRRLGKRHMTDLMPVPTPTYTPLWHFELIGNPNEWQWQAPTTSQYREEKSKKFSMEWVTNWLEDSDFDKPFLDPRADVLHEPETLHIPESLQTPETIYKPKITDESDNTVEDKLATLRTYICGRMLVDHAILRDMRRPYILLMRHRIRSGDFTINEIVRGLHPLEDITKSHIHNNTRARQPLPDYLRNLADLFEMKVFQSTITTVTELRADDPNNQYEELWRAIVADIGSTKPTANVVRAFSHVITCATDADRHHLPVELIVNMIQWVLLNRPIRWNGHYGPAMFIQEFGSALGYLDDTQHALITLHIEKWIQQTQDPVDAEGQPLFPKWLLVQACFMEQEKFKNFKEFKSDIPRIHFNPIFPITATRMLAMKHLTPAQNENLLKTIYESPAHRWNALTSALVQTGGLPALFDAAKLCQRLGCNWIIGSSLLLKKSSDDGLPLIKSILVDLSAPRYVIWAGIDRERKAMGRAERKEIMKVVDDSNPAKPMTQLLDTMTKWLLGATGLTERQVFRGIERCVKTHKYIVGSSSPTALMALVEISIRRLKSGGRAVPSRLDYLIRVVKEELGNAQALRVSRTLKLWWEKNRQELHRKQMEREQMEREQMEREQMEREQMQREQMQRELMEKRREPSPPKTI